MRRYETRSTMMTSNRPLEDWGKLIGDVPSATAILDRFLHHADDHHDHRQELSAAEPGATGRHLRGRCKTSQRADRLHGEEEGQAAARNFGKYRRCSLRNITNEAIIQHHNPLVPTRRSLAGINAPNDTRRRFPAHAAVHSRGQRQEGSGHHAPELAGARAAATASSS